MKRIITIALLLVPVLFSCTEAAKEETQGASSVILSHKSVDLVVGESVSVTATVQPQSLKMDVTWSIVDPNLATVKDGVVTGKAEGVTYLMATSADGLQKATCQVNVNPPSYTISIIGESEHALNGIYGFPGQSEQLSIITSDGKPHTFTWTVEDESVATVTPEGLISLKAVPGTDNAYLYDGSTFLKVRSEEGYGCRIPVRSSLLKGIRLNDTYEAQPDGAPAISVTHSNNYIVSPLYEGEAGPVAIPADGMELELTNSTDFSLRKVGGSYAMTTQHAGEVTTQLLVGNAVITPKVSVAQFEILLIKPELVYASSSTLSFSWTELISIKDDVSRPYTATLYTDEACENPFLSYSIPGGSDCWKFRSPRLVFTGLESNTTYWFRVTDTGEDGGASPVISGTTEAFDIVLPEGDPAQEGDIILAEDFSELCWMADEVSQAAGYDVGADTKSTFQDRTVNNIVGTTGQYCSPERLITKQGTARKVSSLRLGKWAQGSTERLYVGPGYVFLSTYSYPTHLITPTLDRIPEDKTAKIEITLHASGKVNGGNAVLAVQHGKKFNTINANTKTNKNTLDLDTNKETIKFSDGISHLETFTVVLNGVVQGDRIAFGPTWDSTKKEDSSNMMLISDMTIKIIELQ